MFMKKKAKFINVWQKFTNVVSEWEKCNKQNYVC